MRREPKLNPVAAFSRYKDCKLDMYRRKEKLYPYHNLWPNYDNDREYYNEFLYNIWATPAKIQECIGYLGSIPPEAGQITAQYMVEHSQKVKDDFQRQFPPQMQGRPSHNASTISGEAVISHPFVRPTDMAYRQNSLTGVMKHKMPLNFADAVAQELLISKQQAEDNIFEYRRFIILCGMANQKLYPSETIEKVWLLHMAYSSNYIKFCMEGIGLVQYHVPFTGNTSGYDDRFCYDSTLSMYQAVFSEKPCTSCWAPADLRFDISNFTCMFVNLIRLAGMHWASILGNIKQAEKIAKSGGAGGNQLGIGHTERREKIVAKKQLKKEEGTSAGKVVAVGAGAAGAGVLLGAGGLYIASNPNTFDFNAESVGEKIADGFHDGLSALSNISFDDIVDVADGVIGALEDIDWPDIDFDGFADAVGDLFGGVAGFAEELGVAIAEGAADAVGHIGEGIDNVFDF